MRFLVCDDEKQAGIARQRLREAEVRRERLRIPLLVVLETICVLESAYDKSRSEIIAALSDLRQMPVFDFEAEEVIEGLLNDGLRYQVDLADIMFAHAAKSSDYATVITFDKGASKHPLFSLLK